MHKIQKATGQSTRRITDLLTKLVGTGETTCDTEHAQRDLGLISETRATPETEETCVVVLITQRQLAARSP